MGLADEIMLDLEVINRPSRFGRQRQTPEPTCFAQESTIVLLVPKNGGDNSRRLFVQWRWVGQHSLQRLSIAMPVPTINADTIIKVSGIGTSTFAAGTFAGEEFAGSARHGAGGTGCLL